VLNITRAVRNTGGLPAARPQLGEPIRDIPVAVKAKDKPGSVAADAVINLSRAGLEYVDGRYTGTLEVAVFCTDSKERDVGQVRQTVDLKLRDEAYQRFLAEGLRHAAEVPVKASPGHLSFADAGMASQAILCRAFTNSRPDIGSGRGFPSRSYSSSESSTMSHSSAKTARASRPWHPP